MFLFTLLQLFAVSWGIEITPLCRGDELSQNQALAGEKVNFDYYYETLCPYSIASYTEDLENTVRDLAPFLNIRTFPFGNAHILINGSAMKIQCQHGQEECYGNVLHACVIEAMKDPTRYVPFNSCMMKNDRTSNDAAADACGKQLNVDVTPIKECAKSAQGFQLLLHYGMETSKVTKRGVPWWYINGVSLDDAHYVPMRQAICAAFKNPPKACAN